MNRASLEQRLRAWVKDKLGVANSQSSPTGSPARQGAGSGRDDPYSGKLPSEPEVAAEEGEKLRSEYEAYDRDGRMPPTGLFDRLDRLEKVAAQVHGRHYVDWVDTLDEYRSAKRDDEALSLLLDIIDAAERTARVSGREPAPGYTHRAAVIYRRRKDYDAEVAIIERWEAACPPERRGPGATQGKLAERLVRAKELRGGQ